MRPYKYLPHRHPFIMLDKAEIIDEGISAKGKKYITINDPIVLPHGVMPGLFIIEAMAQVSGIASTNKGSSMLAGLRDILFSGTVKAGDILDVESTFERNLGDLYLFNCKASVSGNIVAQGGIILHFNEPS